MIYLDNNATTPVLPEVVEAMLPYFTEKCGNPSSAHRLGREARRAVEEARGHVADLIGAQPNEVIFPSGATEANQTVLRMFKESGKGLVTTQAEHPSVLKVAEDWDAERLHYLPISESGLVCWDEPTVEQGLCSVMWANNETGVIAPVQRLAAHAREQGFLFHTDAVQVAGKVSIDVNEGWVDYLSLSAHKIHGPKGIGALYVREGTPFSPLLMGSQENGCRGGTEAVPLIVGFGMAAKLAKAELAERQATCCELRDQLERELIERIAGASVNGSSDRLPNTTNIRFPGVDGDALVSMLSQRGIMVSTSSACQSSAVTPSHVLLAYGQAYDAAGEAIRFSLSHQTPKEDIMASIDAVVETVEMLTS